MLLYVRTFVRNNNKRNRKSIQLSDICYGNVSLIVGCPVPGEYANVIQPEMHVVYSQGRGVLLCRFVSRYFNLMVKHPEVEQQLIKMSLLQGIRFGITGVENGSSRFFAVHVPPTLAKRLLYTVYTVYIYIHL